MYEGINITCGTYDSKNDINLPEEKCYGTHEKKTFVKQTVIDSLFILSHKEIQISNQVRTENCTNITVKLLYDVLSVVI